MGLFRASCLKGHHAAHSLVHRRYTAIVLKLRGDRGHANTSHGQTGLAIVIFQDLASIGMVMFVLMPAGQGRTNLDLDIALGKAVGIILLALREPLPVAV